tara:strand:- start:25050 stop:26096 length:1047 start_codon:yes stop_codon:yes gene_type:complete
MSNLAVLGANSLFVREQGAIAYSDDGVLYNSTIYSSNPDLYHSLTGAVSRGGLIIAITTRGDIAVGTSLQDMGQGPSIGGNQGWFRPTSMATDNTDVLIAGMYKSNTLVETGAIYTNQENDSLLYVDSGNILITDTVSPEDIVAFSGTQAVIYYPLHQFAGNSIVYNIQHYANAPVGNSNENVWVATGRINSQGAIWYSNNQTTWNTVSLPVEFVSRTIYTSAIRENNWYFGAWGIILTADQLVSPTWESSQELVVTQGQPDIRWIAVNPDNNMLAASSGAIFYSADGTSWAGYEKSGYSFQGAAWFQNAWRVGSSSLLPSQVFSSSNGQDWTTSSVAVSARDIVVLP